MFKYLLLISLLIFSVTLRAEQICGYDSMNNYVCYESGNTFGSAKGQTFGGAESKTFGGAKSFKYDDPYSNKSRTFLD